MQSEDYTQAALCWKSLIDWSVDEVEMEPPSSGSKVSAAGEEGKRERGLSGR